MQIVDEELIAPPATASRLRVNGIGRIPVVSKTCVQVSQENNYNERATLDENLLDCFWPNLCATTVLQELAVLALWDDGEWDGRGKSV